MLTKYLEIAYKIGFYFYSIDIIGGLLGSKPDME